MQPRYARWWTAVSMACLASAGARAADFGIVVNGRPIDTSGSPPAVVRGSLLVPLSAIGGAMGAYLEWRPATRTVYGRQNMNEFLLPVNSRSATVNGREQTLDTPASIIGGRTMVPLRFVATALGADVRFEGSTKTVYINTQAGTGGQSGGTAPPSTASLSIDRFYVEPARPLRAGEAYTVTLEGTPGARAEYDEGSRRHVALPEVSPGRYSATATVPANAPFGRNVIVGRLVQGGATREVQAGDRVVIDTTAPLLKELTPKSGAKVETSQPYITAEFDDQSQSGVDPATVRLTVNGEDVTSQAAVSTGNIVYRPALPVGEASVKLTAADRAGNVANAQWSFSVVGQAAATAPASPVISSPKAGDKVSGKLTVSGTAPAGTTVRVRTTFSGTALVVFTQEGEVNSQEVPVDAKGKWTTSEIALPSPSGLRNVEYTITATTLTKDGLASEPVQLTLARG